MQYQSLKDSPRKISPQEKRKKELITDDLSKLLGALFVFLRSLGVGSLAFYGGYLFFGALGWPSATTLLLACVLGGGKFIGSMCQYYPALKDQWAKWLRRWYKIPLASDLDDPLDQHEAKISPRKKFSNIITRSLLMFLTIGAETMAVGAAVYVALGMKLHLPVYAVWPLVALVAGAACIMSFGMIRKKVLKVALHKDHDQGLDHADGILKGVNSKWQRIIEVLSGRGLKNKKKVARKESRPRLYAKMNAQEHVGYQLTQENAALMHLANQQISKKIAFLKGAFERLQTQLSQLGDLKGKRAWQRRQDLAAKVWADNYEQGVIERKRQNFARRFGYVMAKITALLRSLGTGVLTAVGIFAFFHYFNIEALSIVGLVSGLAFGVGRFFASFYQYTPDLERLWTKWGFALYDEVTGNNQYSKTQSRDYIQRINIKPQLNRKQRVKNAFVKFGLVLSAAFSDGFSGFGAALKFAAKMSVLTLALWAFTVYLPLKAVIGIGALILIGNMFTVFTLTKRKIEEILSTRDKVEHEVQETYNRLEEATHKLAGFINKVPLDGVKDQGKVIFTELGERTAGSNPRTWNDCCVAAIKQLDAISDSKKGAFTHVDSSVRMTSFA